MLLLRALRHRNYRLFIAGQLVSLTGTWMSTVATSWLVFRLTGSALTLGIVGFAGQFPAFLMAPFAGIFVDRLDRRRILLATQSLSMLQSFALAALTFSGRASVPALIALCALQGLINAFDMPCRQAFLIDLIEDKSDLGNAIALNSSMVNAARLVGPAAAGFIIAWSSEAWVFLFDGLSFFAVIASLLAIRVADRPSRGAGASDALGELRAGLRYAYRSVPIRSIILLLGAVSLVGVPYTVLTPIIASDVLGGGPHTLGLLTASTGCGALIGAAWLAARRSVLGLGGLIPAATAVFGGGLILFSFSRSLPLSMALLTVTGFGFMVQLASGNTVLQTVVEDDMRGRVMSLFMTAFLGAAPLGSLAAGVLAERFGAPHTLLLGGLASLAAAAWFARLLPEIRRAVRPIYVRKGILPQAARAVEAAAELSVPPES